MIIYQPEGCNDDSGTEYYCDCCGNYTSFSDHWWPGHYHWAELNYTLCLDCLNRGAAAPPITTCRDTGDR